MGKYMQCLVSLQLWFIILGRPDPRVMYISLRVKGNNTSALCAIIPYQWKQVSNVICEHILERSLTNAVNVSKCSHLDRGLNNTRTFTLLRSHTNVTNVENWLWPLYIVGPAITCCRSFAIFGTKTTRWIRFMYSPLLVPGDDIMGREGVENLLAVWLQVAAMVACLKVSLTMTISA